MSIYVPPDGGFLRCPSVRFSPARLHWNGHWKPRALSTLYLRTVRTDRAPLGVHKSLRAAVFSSVNFRSRGNPFSRTPISLRTQLTPRHSTPGQVLRQYNRTGNAALFAGVKRVGLGVPGYVTLGGPPFRQSKGGPCIRSDPIYLRVNQITSSPPMPAAKPHRRQSPIYRHRSDVRQHPSSTPARSLA
jgi:hypothetical protein